KICAKSSRRTCSNDFTPINFKISCKGLPRKKSRYCSSLSSLPSFSLNRRRKFVSSKSNESKITPSTSSKIRRSSFLAILPLLVQFQFNGQETIIFFDTLRPREATRLNKVGIDCQSQVSNSRIAGFARTMRNNHAIPMFTGQSDRFHGFAYTTNLVDFDQNR